MWRGTEEGGGGGGGALGTGGGGNWWVCPSTAVLSSSICLRVYCLLVYLLTYLEDVRAGLDVLGEGHVGQGVEPQLAAGRVQ